MLALALLVVSSCSSEVYLRDGVTDGDTFYLAQQALVNSDPVLQSWVSYSLTRSACQLQIGGDNPARENSFDCELIARRHLLESWREKSLSDEDAIDAYLDQLVFIEDAGYLDEYVAQYLAAGKWELPRTLDMIAFNRWRRTHLRGHRPVTRIVGSWNYSRNVFPGNQDE